MSSTNLLYPFDVTDKRKFMWLALSSTIAVITGTVYFEMKKSDEIDWSKLESLTETTAKPFPIFRDTLKSGAQGPDMIRIPPGKFRMGDLQGSGNLTERPVHRVGILKPFAMGRYEVTFDEFDQFALPI